MNRTSAWCELFVDALVHAGVREVVISPGSRSTPLVWAFAANGALRVHSVVDERAAGFFALGMAKVSGDPVALVCTSGSAPAHYFPAVLEASVSRVPLLVIAADRPLVLQDVGANQTVSQRSLFGEHARWFADLGEPDATLRGLRMVKRVALQAVARARGPVPGPVQINARFRKPLEPDAAAPAEHVDAGVAERVIAVRREGFAFHRAPVVVADDGAVDALRVAIGKARRGLVVAGPLSADARTRRAVFYFCAHTGFPLVAEATSQLRFTADVPAGVTLLDAFDAALRSSKGLPVPDLVIQVGRPPTSGAWERFVAAHASIPRWIVGDVEFEDPAQTAQGFVVGDTARAFETLAHRAATKVDGAWVKSLVEHDRNAAHALRAASADGAIAEPVAMQAVVDALPAGAVLSVGNSLPVRWADAWVTCRHKDLRVLSQRGLSGIDGLVAGAAGARAASVDPVALVLGDVSLLHDLGSLAVVRAQAAPFLVVVLNNDGGHIFDTLPAARSEALRPHFDLWTTPHGLRFDHAAAMFGLGYSRAVDAGGLARALADGLEAARPTLVEVIVSSDNARMCLERLDAALAESPPASNGAS